MSAVVSDLGGATGIRADEQRVARGLELVRFTVGESNVVGLDALETRRIGVGTSSKRERCNHGHAEAIASHWKHSGL